MEIADVVKVVLPAVLSFTVGIAITPVITHYLYKYKAWKKKPGKIALDGKEAIEFNKIHMHTTESRAPRMGGIVIWGSALITIIGIAIVAKLVDNASISKLDFLSRDQTWIPLVTLIIGAIVGFVNDLMDIRGDGNGLSIRRRILVILAMSFVIGWWFWAKLDITSVGIPFADPLVIGWLIIPFFMLVSLAIYASGVIDGIDGLSGGVFASVFASYTIIAFAQDQINLAAFSATLVGSILAFLWFNIPPARFYMTETGTMGLTLTIAVFAFMTDTLGEGIGIAALPIIGALLVATVISNIVQVGYKKMYGKKLFRIAPLHHHFEAIGWPGYKVTMRYWVLSVVFASAGVILALVAA
jgi:phospho-N-acetylmuramoyl-pentapeptide-transferase